MHWHKATEVEILGISNTNVFTRLEKQQVPRGARILSSKWVLDVVGYKARYAVSKRALVCFFNLHIFLLFSPLASDVDDIT